MSDLISQLQVAIGVLNSAVDSSELQRFLLRELLRLSRADLGLIYRPQQARCWRVMESLPPQSFSAQLAELEVRWQAGHQPHKNPFAQVLETRQGLSCAAPSTAGEYDFSHLRQVEVVSGQTILSTLVFPVADSAGPVPLVVELHRFEQPGSAPFDAEIFSAVAILIHQLAAKTQQLNSQQESSELFESLLQLIGSAIDEKSPFAGDHCRRVPVLAMILARSVDASFLPAFKSIRLSASDLYELEVAAWLHDIGKLMTPIHISDKATKLERTIDRFELVRTRFEILRRDREISRLRAGEEAGEVEVGMTPVVAEQQLADVRFLDDCNRGLQALSAQEMERVRSIAQNYRWCDRQGREMPVITDDEANNLMVVRGTITEAEREMINHHVVSTINMLDMLPFPAALERVPEIAASHHEYYDGRGFPSGLNGEQMLIQSRILGFADRFESVTAGGRPYKKPNSLNRGLHILREMVDAGEADPELFYLFVAERLYEGYAIEFLSREQIDPVERDLLLEGLKA